MLSGADFFFLGGVWRHRRTSILTQRPICVGHLRADDARELRRA